ncbi:phosphopentomutase [Roseinatronobacter sp. S2]|uniref:phosphopentomutase n=1 Tax=Roseinatronobacter sp. S2 TaxID=3035471 RepID=UPI0024105436|nr:phosphopentomutase [Roseinatronobacter sp. S2]WFE76212.1 phosphopentomutase [Roseinatronobacter sp. S2]
MARAFLVVLDSVGCGGAPDAADFGDQGANTLGHVIAACANGRAEDGRSGPLQVPVMDGLGLGAAVRLASGMATPGLTATPHGMWGAATEVSLGKDTPSGHWELAGVPVPWAWTYFPRRDPAFPPELVAQICALAGTDGILGNCHAAGIPIVQELGAAHLRTGWPICYTSADSVVQIAAHETGFGLDRLHRLCADLAPALHAMRVGRVIARPFVGTQDAGFVRTGNRRDFAMRPPAPTLCDWVQGAGGQVHAVGKIGDIFSGQGISQQHKGDGDSALFEHFFRLMGNADAGSLTFCNFVEFDTLYGHTRDVSGYARALERFDKVAGQALAQMRAGDMLVITADHGNDPTAPGTDHTRERVPVLVAGYGAHQIGHCAFADVAASIAAHLGVPAHGPGRSFLP